MSSSQSGSQTNRRAFLAMSTAALAAGLSGPGYAASEGATEASQAPAVPPPAADPLAALRALEKEADDLKLPPAPKGARVGARTITVPPPGDDEFVDLADRYLEVMDRATTAGARSLIGDAKSTAMNDVAGARLRALTRAENPAARAARTVRFTFPYNEAAKEEYRRLFWSCVITPERRALVSRMGNRIIAEPREPLYREVEQKTGVPWYVVGLIHMMECSFSLTSHLHNGDPLSARTKIVPKNRPAIWLPPSDWVSSAIDALTYDKFVGQTDWSLERTLYRLERYNGIGSRRNGINTPYLWSMSNHYTKGKFVADGVWDPNAVSKQVGCAVLLRWLVEDESVSLPRPDAQ
ncbi:MAG TPA: hypothetical protein DCL54_14050 [Alphaproteobacteria bacterium]|nr:hypothetical protein [Alphaproteobacteria bacterium]